MREGEKTLSLLLSREAEASVGYEPERPTKDSKGCSLYLQQHHRESGESQSGHEEGKASGFVTPLLSLQKGARPYHAWYDGCLHLPTTFPRRFPFNHQITNVSFR